MPEIPSTNPMGPNTVWGSHNTGYDPIEMVQKVVLLAWNPSTLEYVKLSTDPDGNLNVNVASMTPTLEWTAPLPETAAVTNVDSVVIAANANRKGLVVTNIGGTDVFFAIDAPAVMNSGITLVPNGTWVMDANTFSTKAIHAICAGGSTIAVQEYQ